MFDESFWVAVSFAIFAGCAIYLKLPAMITRALDDRADRIRKELDEARRLREEAQALYAEYQRKQRTAMQEAEDIVASAEAEAKRLAEQTTADISAQMARRTAMAEAKIAQAEAAAIKEVRDAAVDAAVAAAGEILKARLSGPEGAKLIEGNLAELAGKLH